MIAAELEATDGKTPLELTGTGETVSVRSTIVLLEAVDIAILIEGVLVARGVAMDSLGPPIEYERTRLADAALLPDVTEDGATSLAARAVEGPALFDRGSDEEVAMLVATAGEDCGLLACATEEDSALLMIIDNIASELLAGSTERITALLEAKEDDVSMLLPITVDEGYMISVVNVDITWLAVVVNDVATMLVADTVDETGPLVEVDAETSYIVVVLVTEL